jgi:hypothetical protein
MKRIVAASAVLPVAAARGRVANQKLLTLLRGARHRHPMSGMTTRGFWIAAVVVVVAACGQPQGNPSSSSGSPATSQLLFAVLEANGTTNPSTYNAVAIVGLDGYARAKATFTPMPVPNLGCMGAILPQSAHVAAGKVYFADAKGVVRSLGIDGKVATVATFPMTSSQQMLSFAVSPDGSRLLGTVYTIPTKPLACDGLAPAAAFAFDAYSAPAGGTSTLVSHQTWTKPQNVMALSGWDSVGPVGTYPTVWASQGGGPGSTLGVKVRVDASTIKPGAALADPASCQVWDSITSGAFVCMSDGVMTGGGTADQRVSQPVSIRNADGTEAWRFTMTAQNGPFGPSLAPDGQHVMICCNDLNLSDSHELVIGRDGTQVNLAKGFGASGWLDSTTMVGWVSLTPLSQEPAPMAYVASNAPSTAVSMGFAGLFVGTVRA